MLFKVHPSHLFPLLLIVGQLLPASEGYLIPGHTDSDLELCPATVPKFCAEAECRECLPQSCTDTKYEKRFLEGCCKTAEARSHPPCIDICSADGARAKLLRYHKESRNLITLCPEETIILNCIRCQPCIAAMCKHWADKEVFDDQCRPQLGNDHQMVKQCDDLWNKINNPATISSMTTAVTHATIYATSHSMTAVPHATTYATSHSTSMSTPTTTREPDESSSVLGFLVFLALLFIGLAIIGVVYKTKQSSRDLPDQEVGETSPCLHNEAGMPNNSHENGQNTAAASEVSTSEGVPSADKQVNKSSPNARMSENIFAFPDQSKASNYRGSQLCVVPSEDQPSDLPVNNTFHNN